jgi:hypothetical protein
MRTILGTILLFLMTTTCGARAASLPDWVTSSGYPWQPPEGGVIRDEKAAIIIAHAIWLSDHPDLASGAGNEDDWLKVMQGTLRDGVWEVTAKDSPTPTIGGALFIYLSQRDGHVLAIVLTQ